MNRQSKYSAQARQIWYLLSSAAAEFSIHRRTKRQATSTGPKIDWDLVIPVIPMELQRKDDDVTDLQCHQLSGDRLPVGGRPDLFDGEPGAARAEAQRPENDGAARTTRPAVTGPQDQTPVVTATPSSSLITHTWLTATADLASDCFSTHNEEHDEPEDRVSKLIGESID